jgi:hypothetical protein
VSLVLEIGPRSSVLFVDTTLGDGGAGGLGEGGRGARMGPGRRSAIGLRTLDGHCHLGLRTTGLAPHPGPRCLGSFAAGSSLSVSSAAGPLGALPRRTPPQASPSAPPSHRYHTYPPLSSASSIDLSRLALATTPPPPPPSPPGLSLGLHFIQKGT